GQQLQIDSLALERQSGLERAALLLLAGRLRVQEPLLARRRPRALREQDRLGRVALRRGLGQLPRDLLALRAPRQDAMLRRRAVTAGERAVRAHDVALRRDEGPAGVRRLQVQRPAQVV